MKLMLNIGKTLFHYTNVNQVLNQIKVNSNLLSTKKKPWCESAGFFYWRSIKSLL